MKQSKVTLHPTHLSAVILDQWLTTLEGPDWDALHRVADRGIPGGICYWELHPCGERVDLTSCTTLAAPRERLRLQRWLNEVRSDDSYRGVAARALSAFVGAPQGVEVVGWEEDNTVAGGVGIFATFERGVASSESAAHAYAAFGLSEDVIAQSEALLRVVAETLRIIAVGSFFGREAAPELRLILRPTRTDWVAQLPESIRSEVAELCRALPPATDINLALSVRAEGLYPALETRASAARVPNEAWVPWLDAALPTRSPLHTQLIEALIAQTAPQTSKRWPVEVLLDGFIRARDQVPVLEAHFSHVKVRRGRDGTLERKLYLLFAQRWRQLG